MRKEGKRERRKEKNPKREKSQGGKPIPNKKSRNPGDEKRQEEK